jgi:hypothetical protein
MIYIAHRGNLFGPDPENENTVHKIEKSIALGFDAEVDVWSINGSVYLGHDSPKTEVNESWLRSIGDKLWIHCKNSSALDCFYNTDLNYFFHDRDDYTITSHGYVWAYPGKESAGGKCIAVMPELVDESMVSQPSFFHGVCSDYVFDMANLQ